MLWLYGEEKIPSKWLKRFRKLTANTKLKTARAWAIKELWRDFWKSPDQDRAAETFKEWYREAMATRLEPVKKVARMFKAHLRNILTYFRLRISNGPAEAINSRIQELVAAVMRLPQQGTLQTRRVLSPRRARPLSRSMINPTLNPEAPEKEADPASAACAAKTAGILATFDEAVEQTRTLARLRHYAYRTEMTYLEWIRRYGKFASQGNLQWMDADRRRGGLSA